MVQNCVVCSIFEATGHHYGAQTCSGCKRFFIRVKNFDIDHFKCLNLVKRCSFNKYVRYKCRKCRYQRCLEAGMNVNKSIRGRPRLHKTASRHTDDLSTALNDIKLSAKLEKSLPVEKIISRQQSATEYLNFLFPDNLVLNIYKKRVNVEEQPLAKTERSSLPFHIFKGNSCLIREPDVSFQRLAALSDFISYATDNYNDYQTSTTNAFFKGLEQPSTFYHQLAQIAQRNYDMFLKIPGIESSAFPQSDYANLLGEVNSFPHLLLIDDIANYEQVMNDLANLGIAVSPNTLSCFKISLNSLTDFSISSNSVRALLLLYSYLFTFKQMRNTELAPKFIINDDIKGFLLNCLQLYFFREDKNTERYEQLLRILPMFLVAQNALVAKHMEDSNLDMIRVKELFN